MIRKFMARRLARTTMNVMYKKDLNPQGLINNLVQNDKQDLAAIYQKELNKIICKNGDK